MIKSWTISTHLVLPVGNPDSGRLLHSGRIHVGAVMGGLLGVLLRAAVVDDGEGALPSRDRAAGSFLFGCLFSHQLAIEFSTNHICCFPCFPCRKRIFRENEVK